MADKEQVVDYLKRVTADLRRTRQRVRDLEEASREPIAIISMQCRFPGHANTPEEFWELLRDGRDVMGEYPADRGWRADRSGADTRLREGGFIDGAADFAAGFFGISPREALEMDPQQRVLLETSWELFERAGIDPAGLHGSRTGVFIGVNGSDYGAVLTRAGHQSQGHLLTGMATSVVSGRIAFSFGFEGPAITVDTACSASLVALHLAAQALRSGDCGLALAGGVTVMATPELFAEFDRQGGMSLDARCKTFAASADGTAWSEGVGVLLVERLSDAVANGHRVLAVVRGSAVNQDGASNGLTAPNGPSQQRVIRDALASAGLAPSDVDAVEAHGTGTTLGDPIEAQAILATYGQNRPSDRPVLLGAVKSNIGHTQAAAGVASVIKMVLAMRHGIVPATLHVDEPTPHVDWSSGAVRLATSAVPWPEMGRPRRSAVSSFGISGTNAHVILEGVATEPVAGPAVDGVVPWVVSAKSEPALRGQAARLRDWCADGVDVAATAAGLAARTAFEHRAVVLADRPADFDKALAALRRHVSTGPHMVHGTAAPGSGVAFVFSGQGTQWPGMGQQWYDAIPAFAEAFDAVAEIADTQLDVPLKDTVFGLDHTLLDQTRYAQVAVFAVEVALFRTLAAWGVRPALVLGHSIGEIAAAHVAGVLSLADAVTLVVARGALTQVLPPGGAMLAIAAGEQDVLRWLADSPAGQVSLAAVNSPSAAVVSGTTEQVARIARLAEQAGRRTRELRVSHAFHSPLIEPALAGFRAVLDALTWSPPTLPVVSTVTGAMATGTDLASPDYWLRHARQGVRFQPAVRVARRRVDAFIELGPHSALTRHIADSLETDSATVVAAAHPTRPQVASLLRAVATLWTRGIDVDWRAVLPPAAHPEDLPTYAFERRRSWPVPRAGGAADVASAGLTGVDHPLLGATVSVADGDTTVLTGLVSTATHPWLADHLVLGRTLFPGTAFVELVLRAGRDAGCGEVLDLTVSAPLVLEGTAAVRIQMVVGPADSSGRRSVTVHSRPDAATDEPSEWTRHADAMVGPLPHGRSGTDFGPVTGAVWPPAGAAAIDVTDCYPALARHGYEYGPAFRGLRGAWRRGDDVFADVVLPDTDAAGFGIHPALLDAVFHAMSLGADDDMARVPFAWSGVRLLADGARSLRVWLARTAPHTVRVRIADSSGVPVAGVDQLALRPMADAHDVTTDALFVPRWQAWRTAVPSHGDPPPVWRDGVPAASLDASAGVALLDCTNLTAEGTVPEQVHTTVTTVLARLRDWALANDELTGVRLVVLTRGGVDVEPDDDIDLAQAALHGLVRSARAEHPDRFALLDTDGTPVALDVLRAAFADDETEIAVRGDRIFVPRLARPAPPDDDAPERRVADGTVLVTGGTGTIGAAVARHMVAAHGVTDIVLASRRGPDAPGAAELARQLGDLGAKARVVACDIGDRQELAALLAGIADLSGVVHAAGALDDGVLTSMTPDRVATAMRPKVNAGWHLHELTRDRPLALFAVFSSAAGIFGGPGQANYAAANTFLDALARHRRREGLVGVSLAWGYWAELSTMTGSLSDADFGRIARGGLLPISETDGLALFDAAVASADPVLAPVRIDLRGQANPPALLRGLVRTHRPARPEAPAGPAPEWRDTIAALPPARRSCALLDVVRDAVALVLGHASPEDVEAGDAFKDLGFDSLTAVELRNRLAEVTGIRLPSTLVFDYPNPQSLADFLGSSVTVPAPAAPRRARAVPVDEPIAIIGMSCRYPGGIRSPEDLWRLVESGAVGIGPFPTDRGWDLAALYDPDGDLGPTYVRESGFLYDAADFDAGFFGVSPREAMVMDPQHRLLLELSWEAVERAGLDVAGLRGSRTGVFTGLMYHDYAARLRVVSDDVLGFLSTGNSGSVASGRVSYWFGFEGPAVTVDTACSSSLVALDMAVTALRGGTCDLALAGGVAVASTATGFLEIGRQGGLAADARCKAFAATADGTAWSEGVGVLLVERLSDAVANGHQVLAVVRGCAVNQDGASNGLTAPNGPSQQRVIRDALASAGLESSDVDVVEAHGTGTRLGDPIEAQAILATYGQDRPADRPVLLGSVKSNIGHTQAAAGVAGVIKMVLALRRGVVPATLHVDEPTPHVDWSSGAVELVRASVPWPEVDRVRRAAVSSFGISGTNAHVIVEGVAVEPVSAPAVRGVVPWVVSAKSESALRGQAERLRDWCADGADLAVTGAGLATRTVFDHRAVVLGATRADVVAGLDALAHEAESGHVVRGDGGQKTTVAFAFPVIGARWAELAGGLVRSSQVFAQVFDECADALASCVDWDPRDESAAHRPGADGPASWAVLVALAAVWRSVGVVPSVVAGHAEGEIAARCVAGAMSVLDGARLVTSSGDRLPDLTRRDGDVPVVSVDDPARWPDVLASLAVTTTVDLGSAADGHDGWTAMVTDMARVWTRNVDVDWSALLPAAGAVHDLPTYAFDRQRYWLDATEPDGDMAGSGFDPVDHPVLVAAAVAARGDGMTFGGRLSAATLPWLLDHSVRGAGVVPGSVFAELVASAAARVDCGLIDELMLESPLAMAGDVAVQVRVGDADESGARTVTVHSRHTGASAWTRHAHAVVSPDPGSDPAEPANTWPPAGATPVAWQGRYGDLAAAGYEYGEAFHGVRAVWRRPGEVFADIALPGDLHDDRFACHPVLLDIALHAMAVGDFFASDDEHMRVPFAWSTARMRAVAADSYRVHLSAQGTDAVTVSVTAADGRRVADIARLAVRAVPVAELRPTAGVPSAPVRRARSRKPAGSDILARLASAAPAEHHALLENLVRTELASILGLAGADAVHPDVDFLDIGVESVTAVELRDRLGDVLNVTLPSTLTFEYPTAAALATHLVDRITTRPAATSPFDSIEGIFRESYALGQAATAGMDLIKAAGRMRTAFTTATAADHAVPPISLSTGDGKRVRLVCVSAITATAGPVQYARLARQYQGKRDIQVLINPGFGDGELVPDSFDSFVEAQFAALRATVGTEPFVLLGHSAGGFIAHALAVRAEQAGIRPAASVLIDTYLADATFSARTSAAMTDGLFAREHLFGREAFRGVRLTAMGRYYDMMDGCEPRPANTPTLFLCARDPLPYQADGVDADGWRPRWPFPHTPAITPGDHFTIMEDHIVQTTEEIESWLAGQGL